MNEWIIRGLPFYPVPFYHKGKKEAAITRSYSLPDTGKTHTVNCAVLLRYLHLFPSESSLMVCPVSPHHWQILLGHPKETKLKRRSPTMQHVNNTLHVKILGCSVIKGIVWDRCAISQRAAVCAPHHRCESHGFKSAVQTSTVNICGVSHLNF